MIYIGIDAGVDTGFSVWDSIKRKPIEIDTLTFWETIYRLDHYFDLKPNVKVVIEDVIAHSSIFGVYGTYNNTKGDHKNKLAACCKQAERVGSVKDKTQLYIDFCEQNEIPVIRIIPTKKSLTKLNQEKFFNLTKIDKSLEGVNSLTEHSRDATMLVFGR